MKTQKKVSGPRTEKSMAKALANLLGRSKKVRSARTYDDVGMLTLNKGVDVRLANGKRFQLTVVGGVKVMDIRKR